MGIDGEQALPMVLRLCGERYPWRAHNRILEYNSAQKKMKRRFSGAHAVLQGLCENLINAHKLLASQQKDGDSPIPNIIMDLKEKCRERITNGLGSFIDLDSHKAVEVGRLRGGQRSFEVVRPKMSGDCSEVLREGADDFDAKSGRI